MTLDVRPVRTWRTNKSRSGGRYVNAWEARIGDITCTAATAKAAKDGLLAGLAAWHSAGHDKPTIVTSHGFTGVLMKRPLYCVDPDNPEVEWEYGLVDHDDRLGSATIMGGKHEDALRSLRCHLVNRVWAFTGDPGAAVHLLDGDPEGLRQHELAVDFQRNHEALRDAGITTLIHETACGFVPWPENVPKPEPWHAPRPNSNEDL